jgi:hypothetical protein
LFQHYYESAADAPRSAFASFSVRFDTRIQVNSLAARLHLQLQKDVAVFRKAQRTRITRRESIL